MSLNEIRDEDQDKSLLESAEERARLIDDDFEKDNLPDGYSIDEKGLWFQAGGEAKQVWVSSPLRVVAISRNARNEAFGRCVEFEDLDGMNHKVTVPMELLSGDGKELRGILMSQGLEIASDKDGRRCLLNYLLQSKPRRRERAVNVTGWHGLECFILPTEIIGGTLHEILSFVTPAGFAPGYGKKGTLDNWREEIAVLCKGNSRLIFAMSLGFAAPLLHFHDEENSGFHFRGPSTIGKTTALLLAGSVWGGRSFVQRWRTTTNGLEGIALAHNDTLLCLDELAQIDPAEVGGAAYMLANGQSKVRANKEGSARTSSRWRLLFLSSGELSLADHIAQSGKKIKAGQEVRVVDIPADTGVNGLFEEIHRFENGKAFSQHLIAACNHDYGLAGPEFIRYLLSDWSHLDFFQAEKKKIMAKMPLGSTGQESRVFQKFAFVGAAGELATKLGLTGWNEGEAEAAACACFDAWITARGGFGSHEEKAALAQIRKFFQENEKSRFSTFEEDDKSRLVIKRAGYRRLTDLENGAKFYVFPEVYKKEICFGLDHSFVSRICIQHGWLIPESGGNPTRAERLPLSLKARVYLFSSKVLGDYEKTSETTEMNETED